MLWPYALKVFVEQLNVLKVENDGITSMENFADTTTNIYPNTPHTWGCPVYVLDEILKVIISGLPKWEPWSRAWIYLVQ